MKNNIQEVCKTDSEAPVIQQEQKEDSYIQMCLWDYIYNNSTDTISET